MTHEETHVVTGAFGYSGRYLTRRLIDAGIRVKTLTDHPGTPDPFRGRVESHPFSFDDPDALARFLEGCRVLYNSYWVRFDHGGTTHALAVERTRILFEAARRAGVERIVHVSITNPSLDSPLPYFRGKAELERALRETGIPHAVVRPTVLFGEEDILVNNIAWLLRRLPVFGVPGDGTYRVQPVFVDDHAALMARLAETDGDVVVDAVGPEILGYGLMVRLVRDTIGARCPVVRCPPWLVLATGRVAGRLLGDVVITRDEVRGLMADLLVSADPPTCPTSFRAWIRDHRERLGRSYANEVRRHFRRPAP